MNEETIKAEYLKLNHKEKGIKSFLDQSSYDYNTKKFTPRWLSPERLTLEVYLREVEQDQVLGTMENLKYWHSYWQEDFPGYELKTEYSSIHRGCGEWEYIFELYGCRLESDEEYNLRLKLLNL